MNTKEFNALSIDWKSIFKNTNKLFEFKFVSCYVYRLQPGATEPIHYHDGIEIVYIMEGNCKTHQKGKIYFYKPGKPHFMVNDTAKEVVFVNIQLPSESDKRTHFTSHST